MPISNSNIAQITALAKLEIDSSRAQQLGHELSGILELIHQMQQIDTADVEPMSHPQDLQLRLRADCVTEPDQRASLQAIAPQIQDGLYIVPKVLD